MKKRKRKYDKILLYRDGTGEAYLNGERVLNTSLEIELYEIVNKIQNME